MVGGIGPGDAFRVRATDIPYGPAHFVGRCVHAQVIGLRAVETSNQLVVAALRNLGRVVPQSFANPVEGVSPGIPVFQPAFKFSVPGPGIIGADA
ncbi:MAG: hypothetical protein BWX80_03222 [Candidatus Hydrogenedentes bacterium ADurb.Bin101]|nr:MAG: hypothetical protein BWX80_03222 [Candidatus Hydrogenedentes bacterium ADurb.Bin101]